MSYQLDYKAIATCVSDHGNVDTGCISNSDSGGHNNTIVTINFFDRILL